MHLYLATRGPKYIRDIWVANMQSQMFQWKRKNLKTGVEELTEVQANLKPIELWEVVIPEEALPEMLWYLGINPKGKQVHSKPLEKIAFFFRQALGLKKIPKYEEKGLMVRPRLIYREGFSIYGLGIKEDAKKEFPQYGYYQEGL